MYSRSIRTVIIFLSLLFFIPNAGAAELPGPKGAVNDFAGILSQDYKRSMEMLAAEVLEKTGTSIVIATVKSIDGGDPADYANKLYEKWGIGDKEKDRGVLIFMALNERRVRIETGYGVEGILPDGLVGNILDEHVVPYLKENNYDRGIANALVAISQVIAKDSGTKLTGRPKAVQDRYPERTRKTNPFSLILMLIVLSMLFGTRRGRSMLPFLLLMLFMGGGRGSGFGGGGFGGFGGGFGGFGGGMSGGGGAGRGF